MTSEPVRIAIVGLDHWYTAIPLAQGLALHPEAELVGIYDSDESRAKQVATKVGCQRVASSAAELIEDDGVDVIAAFASVDRNPETCIAAAEAGKHIVSIKPLARTLEEATKILTAVRKAGVRFLPAESRGRAAAHHRQLRTWAQEGRFGTPLTATFQMWAGLPQGWPGASNSGWFTDVDRAPGGGWIDHSIYHIDLLRWMFDASVVKVSGRTANLKHAELPFEDYGHAIVEFDNGLVASIEDTWTAPAGGGRSTTSIVGTDGAVLSDSISGRVSLLGSMHGFDGWAHVAPSGTYPDGVDDIVAVGRDDRDQLATVEDAWQNFAVCRAFYAAAASGSVLSPEPLPAPEGSAETSESADAASAGSDD